MRLTVVPLVLAIVAIAACASTTTGRKPAPSTTAPIAVPAITHPQGETAAWWYRAGAARAAGNGAMAGKAKNVIVFLGDGMSLTTVAAARIHEGQRKGGAGEENSLAFERFPHTALSKTYNTDYQTPDSAGTMTAIATGAKTRLGVIGIAQSVARGDCAGTRGHELLTFIELAESAGLRTGLVTTARLTHATPASTYAHLPDRSWENDSSLPPSASVEGCADIAAQLIDSPFGNGPEVALGGGRAAFLPATTIDPEYPDQTGRRADGRDLVAEWRARHPLGHYAWNASQLSAAGDSAALLGLFEPSHMQYEGDRAGDRGGEPSLAELTATAIRTLQAGGSGFVLLVEGGRIDHGHHEGNARRALEETVALSDAVRVAESLTSEAETLLLVTADHAHTLHFAGYPRRGNAILGKVSGKTSEGSEDRPLALGRDGRSYTTLGYANGPGAVPAEGPRPDLHHVDTTARGYRQQSLVPLATETHGGEDVGVWARGPGADAVRGTVEQNALYHFIVQATPALRARLCAAGTCNADGVPVDLPRPDDFKAK
jgi:alkaline phosphatase